MSKKLKQKTPEFTYSPTQKLPKLKRIQTTWDLPGLFYKSPTDKQLLADVDTAEKKYLAFAKKYARRDFTKTDVALLKSLHDYRALSDTNLDKVFVYLFLCREKNAADVKAEQALNQLQQRVTQFSNTTIFYSLALGRLPAQRQKSLLRNETFKKYHFLLKGIFENAKYTLSEAEEKIMSLKSLTSRSLWISGTEKIVNNATITVNGKDEPLNGAMLEMLDAPKARRHALWKGVSSKLKEIGPVAENELTALLLDKKISDELRGYEKPYSATVRSFDTTEKSLEALEEAVTTHGYKASKRYYALKSKLYGKKIDYIDRDDYSKRLPPVTFKTAVTICRDAFYDFNPIYGGIFDEMLQHGHIDVYSHKGKGGGAFNISSVNTPTMVMLNHSSDFGSLRTLAHEMGHAIHAYRSKKQDILYEDHSVVTAETASTFFEAVVGRSLMDQMTESEKTIYLNALIRDKIATMIMCIARYRAELEMHETVRRQGSMTWQEMSAVLAKHFRQYCGSAINITDDDGLSVIAKTHYRRNFYQFTYSFGVIASSIMFKRCQESPEYKTQVDTFLCAGEKDSVENIFKEIGIDTTKPAVFQEGIELLNNEIDLFESLVKK